MYLPVLHAIPPPAARVNSSPPKRFRRSIERQPAAHVNGYFVTAASIIFQRAEGCAVLLLGTGIGCGKERVPAVSLSLWLYPFHPLPSNTTIAPTPNLSTSNCNAKVLPPKHFLPKKHRTTTRCPHVSVFYIIYVSINHGR